MEVIKTTPNLEFDVIYADGTRKRVQEGVLYEAEDTGDIIFHNGTNRPEVLIAAAETVLLSLAAIGPGLEALALGMALRDESRAALLILTKFASNLLNLDSAEKQAIFRLGQMDMQQSVAAMLLDAANEVNGLIRSTLLGASDAVKALEVTNADT